MQLPFRPNNHLLSVLLHLFDLLVHLSLVQDQVRYLVQFGSLLSLGHLNPVLDFVHVLWVCNLEVPLLQVDKFALDSKDLFLLALA